MKNLRTELSDLKQLIMQLDPEENSQAIKAILTAVNNLDNNMIKASMKNAMLLKELGEEMQMY